VEEQIFKRFHDGLYGTAAYNTSAIMRIMDVNELFEEEPKSTIEMRDHGEGRLAFVITSEDGTVRHWIASAKGNEGQPRPTTPGTYWNPEKPTEVYTLIWDGWHHNTDGKVSPADVPDDLQLLGAFE
jgi:hypothetical protein